MGFGNVSARFKQHAGDEDTNKKSKQEQKPVDLPELYALRAKMLGVLVRDARVASGYTVEDVAAELGVAAETVVEWEFGRYSPSLPELELLAYFLKIPISHFWGTETLVQQQSRRTVDGREFMTLRTHMIGAMVRARRESEGIALIDLAAQVGVPAETLYAYELGQLAVPMAVLVSLASFLRVNLEYFLVDSGRVGEYFGVQEGAKVLSGMSPDVRAFVSTPKNEAYIRVAMTLANLPTEDLRKLAEGLLDITL